MKILNINCHPDYISSTRTTNVLLHYGETLLKNKYPKSDVTTINLYDDKFILPRIDRNFIKSTELSATRIELVRQWKDAELIFIYSPLHNFGIPSKLKDYIDQILTPKETFKYENNSFIGLLSNEDCKVSFILSSGSDYREDFKYINMDFAPNYLRGVLNVMGITNMHLIRAQGLDMRGNNKLEIIDNAKKELENYILSL